MQAALMRTGGWLVVNETIEEPSNCASSDWRDWATTNMIAAGLIYQSLEESVQPIVRNQLDSSIKMWNTLEKHFSAINATSRFLGYDEFLSIKKEDDESLGALVTRVEDVLQNLLATHLDNLYINTF